MCCLDHSKNHTNYDSVVRKKTKCKMSERAYSTAAPCARNRSAPNSCIQPLHLKVVFTAKNVFMANTEFRVPYSQWYLVLGLVGLVLPLLLRLGLVGLALWLVSGIALNKYHCEYGTLN